MGNKHPKNREQERQEELKRIADWKIQKDIEQADAELGVNAPETILKNSVYQINSTVMYSQLIQSDISIFLHYQKMLN